MYLKSLEMQGFKSFPDKTVLEFDKGITAVVGPNGSGKSNIGDAMRWVLGEVSSKNLRGSKMEDVIFSGTKFRKAENSARVTLTIDNADHALNTDSDIVMVTRKLYRSGESQYSLNGQEVRLKDIVELFMDTGLGRDGYSIIGQGRIAEIVSNKSSQRREIFEEAAGISRIRFKKAQAQKQLEGANENLVRLEDIEKELAERLAPLEKQAAKAKRFRILDAQKRELEISVWSKRLKSVEKNADDLQKSINQNKAEYDKTAGEIASLDDLIEQSVLNGSKLSAKVDEIKEKIHSLQLSDSQSASKIAVLQNDIEHINKTVAELCENLENADGGQAKLEKSLEDAKAVLEKLQTDYDDSLDSLEDIQNSLMNIGNSEDNINKLNREKETQLNTLIIDISKLEFKISEYSKRLKSLKAQQTDYENSDFSDAVDTALEKCKAQEKAVQGLEEKLDEIKNRGAGYQKLLESKLAGLEKARSELSDADIKRKEIISRINILGDLENSMEGFSYSVKAVIHSNINGICDTVAGAITVEEKYSLAIETALGAAMQNIIVENESSAKQAIEMLKSTKKGRATFLPISVIKPKFLNEQGFDVCGGFVSIASELVSCEPKYKNIIGSLLGRVAVAEDLSSATDIARKYSYRFKIVTLDGQVINAGGSFTGGSSSRNTGILSRKAEISQLNEQGAKLKSKCGTLADKLEKLTEETSRYKANVTAQQEEYEQVSAQLAEKKQLLSQSQGELENLKIRQQSSLNLIEQNKQTINSLVESIENAEQELSEKKALSEKMQSERADSDEQARSLRKQRERKMQEVSACQIKTADIKKDIALTREKINQLNLSIEMSAEQKQQTQDKIKSLKIQAGEKANEIRLRQQNFGDSEKKSKELEKQSEQARQEFMRENQQADLLRVKQKKLIASQEIYNSAITRDSERKQQFLKEFDKIVANFWDIYELTRTEADALAKEISNDENANAELAHINRQIKELGGVDLDSIEEYEKVSERYEQLKKQLTDVRQSKKELENLIEDLTGNMKTMFAESFNAINTNFKQIFSELFGGGSGELVLDDKENVLECGIEIKVEPPGKVIKNLSLLSGGEQAFVAVAIYFAILKNSPSPFVLLDEIEAALDDVNVARYAQYLHKFTDKTQFIAITHRRGTMEEADVLYGVTMQENGVSKLLKMNN